MTRVLTADDLVAVLEAARWAATWGHRQPVRFLVGLRGDETNAAISELLKRGNSYAKAAGALVMVCADEGEDERTARYAAVDAGAAIAQLTIEAVSRGLIAHPMAGFNADGAREVFGIPEGVRPIAVVAVGSLGRLRQRATGDRRTRCAGPRQAAAGGSGVRGALGATAAAVRKNRHDTRQEQAFANASRFSEIRAFSAIISRAAGGAGAPGARESVCERKIGSFPTNSLARLATVVAVRARSGDVTFWARSASPSTQA